MIKTKQNFKLESINTIKSFIRADKHKCSVDCEYISKSKYKVCFLFDTDINKKLERWDHCKNLFFIACTEKNKKAIEFIKNNINFEDTICLGRCTYYEHVAARCSLFDKNLEMAPSFTTSDIRCKECFELFQESYI